MKAIVAMDPSRVIGNKGNIPWHIPDDFRWFKQFTMGKTLVMGKTTFLSLPPLKGRKICVITNEVAFSERDRQKCDGLFIVHPRDIPIFADELDDCIVAGGAKTYSLLLPYCTDVYVTHVLDDYEGDAYMPEFEHDFPNQEIVKESKDYWIVRYFRWVESISPELNQGRKDFLHGKTLANNPYSDKKSPEWAMWMTGYVEQKALKNRNRINI